MQAEEIDQAVLRLEGGVGEVVTHIRKRRAARRTKKRTRSPQRPLVMKNLRLRRGGRYAVEADIEPISWSREDVLALHDCLLERSLFVLDDGRCGIDEVEDVLAWVSASDPKQPFSFDMCCLLAGLSPEALRKGVLVRLGSRLKNLNESPVVGEEENDE